MSAHRALARSTGKQLPGIVIVLFAIAQLSRASPTRGSLPWAQAGLPLETARFAGPLGPTLFVTGLMATDPDPIGGIRLGLRGNGGSARFRWASSAMIGAPARAAIEATSDGSRHGA